LLPRLRQIDSNRWYTNFGPLVRCFEERLARFVDPTGRHSCVSVSSGMSALELALRALGVRRGSRVMVPALTFPATALAVQRIGAEVVVTDVCADSWALTPAIARQVLGSVPCDLVIPVAAFGQPVPACSWDAFVADTGVPVLIDAAAALGTQVIGDRTHWMFSLHATKPLGIGEGGVVCSADHELVARIRRLSNFGFDGGIAYDPTATNAKLTEFAAAVGLTQLDRWPAILASRKAVWDEYRKRLAFNTAVRLPPCDDSPPAVLSIQLSCPAVTVAQSMAAAGIETRRWYLPPIHRHPAFASASSVAPDGTSSLPVAERLGSSLLGLPFHGFLSIADVDRVCEELERNTGRPA
jgi:dTDP-4-amino-4,6-dideoxygalactose transaminase